MTLASTLLLGKTKWLAKLLKMDADDLLVIGLNALLIVLVGFVVGRMLGRFVGRIAERRGGLQAQMIAKRLVFYAVFGIAVFMALEALGLDLGVLLGAAGILTVAIGFASQTSASNLISGLFLLGERPFVVGDTIQVANTLGVVLSVDLLSVKLRTFDNLFVRVPNETLIKSEIINYSRNPIRRIDVDLRVAYTEDLGRVRALLFAIAEADPEVLQEPEPSVFIDQLGESAVHVRFLVWAANQASFMTVRSRVREAVARAMVEERVAIGYHKVEVDDENTAAIAASRLSAQPEPAGKA